MAERAQGLPTRRATQQLGYNNASRTNKKNNSMVKNPNANEVWPEG